MKHPQILTAVLVVSLPFAPAVVADVLEGTSSGDVIEGTDQNDVLVGFDGDDDLIGKAGDDVMSGGSGFDFLLDLEGGNDRMFGGPGPDVLRPGNGDDVMFGGPGSDQLEHIALLEFGVANCDAVTLPEYDISRGGEGDDQIVWASGSVSVLGAPLLGCAHSGHGDTDGGRGWDHVLIGLGAFSAVSSDYVIEPATLAGFTWQVRSIASGATLNMRNIEEVVFQDTTVIL